MPTTVFCPPMIRLNPPCGPDYEFTFCGYPGNAIRLKEGGISRTLHLYTSLGIDRSKYLRVGASHMSHVAIDICNKVRDPYGKKIWLPRSKGLKGLSGGPVLALTDGSGLPAVPTARVVGVAIRQRLTARFFWQRLGQVIRWLSYSFRSGIVMHFAVRPTLSRDSTSIVLVATSPSSPTVVYAMVSCEDIREEFGIHGGSNELLRDRASVRQTNKDALEDLANTLFMSGNYTVFQGSPVVRITRSDLAQ
jgi:hypothetical protein